jgi:phosphatidylglycerophosphate synthase
MNMSARDASFTPYRPTSRRPIADALRATASLAVRGCVRLNVHPDVVSYGSVVAAALAAACLLLSRRWPWLLLVAPLLCYARLWLNMLDGMVALASGKASLRGEIINELPDRVSDVLIFAGVAHSGWVHAPLAYWAMTGALLTAYVGTLGQAIAGRREFGGVMSKPWRMVMLHVGAWATLLMWSMGRDPRNLAISPMDWCCAIIIIGCVQTMSVRLRATLKLLEQARETRETRDLHGGR